MVETCVVMSKDVMSIGHSRYIRFRYTGQILNIVKNQKTWHKIPLKGKPFLISWLILKQKFLFLLEISKESLAILNIFVFVPFLTVHWCCPCLHLLNELGSIKLPLFDQQSNLNNMVHTQGIELFTKYGCYRVRIFF